MNAQELVTEIRALIDRFEATSSTDVVAEDYREDGFSHETSNGCRRFKEVDELTSQWRKVGDPDHIEAADTLGTWWGFNPADFPEFQSDSMEDKMLVTAAFQSNWSLIMLGIQVTPFSTRAEGPIFRHNIALVNSGDPAAWVRQWLDERKNLPARVKQIRERHEKLGVGRPRPSPLPPGWGA